MRHALLLLLTAAVAGTASAQTPIRLGQTLEGRLEAPDARGDDGAFYDVYTFRSDADRTVTVQLHADAFDAYLYAGTGTGADWTSTATDDDGGPNLDSRLVLQVRAGQTVVLRASGLGEEATGAYTLSVEEGEVGGDDAPSEEPGTPEPTEVDPSRIQTIRLDASTPGRITAQGDALFRFTPAGPGTFTLVVDTSDFDVVMEAGTLSGTTFTPTLFDDDSGRGLNPLAVYNAENATPLIIRVRGFEDNAGAFGLRVRTGDVSADYADPEEPGQPPSSGPVEVDPARIQNVRLDVPVSSTVESGVVTLFRFTPTTAGPFTAVVDTSDFDPILETGTLEGTTFTPTGTDDDGGRGLNPLLVLEGVPGTPVYLRVMGFADGAGRFGLRVLDGDMTSLYADPEESYEEGGMGPRLDFSAATTVNAGTTRRTLAPSATALEWDESRVFDLLRFDAPRTGMYTVVVTSSAFDPSLEIGQAVDSLFIGAQYDDDAGVGRGAALVMEMETGTHYLRILSDTLRRGPYTVEILEGDQGNRFLEANLPDRVELARAVRVRVGQAIEAALTDTDPVDLPWDAATDLYLFEATAGQTVTFEIEATSDADPYLEVGSLEGDVFTRLAFDDDGSEGLGSLLTHTFERAGRYLVRVSAINRANGAYTLRVR